MTRVSPLDAVHRSLGARMVEFGGWDMPVEYRGIADEHMAVRTRAGETWREPDHGRAKVGTAGMPPTQR